MLNRFQEAFSRKGYAFTMHWIREEDEEGLRLPLSFDRGKTSGVICIETPDHRYCSMLCGLDIPVLFVPAESGFHLSGQPVRRMLSCEGDGAARQKADRVHRGIYALPVFL